MSSFLEKAKIALGTAKDVIEGAVKGEEIVVTAEEKEKRLAICKGCPHYLVDITGQPRCNECKCFMNLKAALNKAKCPIGRW